MIDLDDTERFVKLVDIWVDWAWAYGNTMPGSADRERRERYRSEATKSKIEQVPDALCWWLAGPLRNMFVHFGRSHACFGAHCASGGNEEFA